jgi:hypothetical protein
MAVLLPGPGFTNVGGMWEIFPTPGATLYQTPREGFGLNIYEMINPVPITAQSSVVCPGGTPFSLSQPSPELITGVSIAPGSSANRSGVGVTVLASREGIGNIPEMAMPIYSEPYIKYFDITSAPVFTLVLPVPLTGYVSEKYFWDGEAGFSELYKGKETPLLRDNIRGVSKQGGVGIVKTPGFPRDKAITVKKNIPGSGTLPISDTTPLPGIGSLTIGSPATERAAVNSSYMWSMRPSMILVERLFFTITVTSTCPPYIWYFPAYMDVENNWTAHGKRILYRINRQKTALPGEEAKF